MGRVIGSYALEPSRGTTSVFPMPTSSLLPLSNRRPFKNKAYKAKQQASKNKLIYLRVVPRNQQPKTSPQMEWWADASRVKEKGTGQGKNTNTNPHTNKPKPRPGPQAVLYLFSFVSLELLSTTRTYSLSSLPPFLPCPQAFLYSSI
jgi:hypothetical protein